MTELKWYEKLKIEMIEEAGNGMKQIAKDWDTLIKKRFDYYKRNKLSTQESFFYALLDCGYDPYGYESIRKMDEEDYVC